MRSQCKKKVEIEIETEKQILSYKYWPIARRQKCINKKLSRNRQTALETISFSQFWSRFSLDAGLEPVFPVANLYLLEMFVEEQNSKLFCS